MIAIGAVDTKVWGKEIGPVDLSELAEALIPFIKEKLEAEEETESDYSQSYAALLALKGLTRPVHERWGERMPLMGAEEAGEFTQAVSKLERRLVSSNRNIGECLDQIEHLEEEMGDVLIVIGALMCRYSIPACDIVNAIKNKLSQTRTE